MTGRRWLLALWVCLLVTALTMPWSRLTTEAQWERVRWFEFVGPVNERDIVVNVALFLPLGFLLAGEAPHRHREDVLWWVVSIAAAFSSAGELVQLFNPSRYPSAMDIACNTVGACLGGWLCLVWGGRRA